MKNTLKNLVNNEILIFFLVIIFIFFLSYFFFGESLSNIINLINKYPRVAPENGVLINQQDSYIIHLGYLGSFLQGSIGLIVSIVIMFTIFITFSIERKRVNAQRLEDRFYHLLEMHNDNVKSMNIDFTGGRLENSKVILNIFRELEAIVKILKIKLLFEQDVSQCLKIKLSKRDRELYVLISKISTDKKISKYNLMEDNNVKNIISELGFLIVLLGCGERSSIILKNYILKFENQFDVSEIINLFSNNIFREEVAEIFKFKYKLFGGHQSRLGH